MTFDSLLIHEITLQNKYSSQNILGEWNYIYSSASTTTDCRCSPISYSERIDSQGLFDDVRYKCFVDSDVLLSTNNRVIYNSDTYRVKDVIKDSNAHHKTGLLVLI